MKNTFFVSKEAVVRGHGCRDCLRRISLEAVDAKELDPLPNLKDSSPAEYNDKTMLITIPPLLNPAEALENVYELRTQREIARYYHADVDFQ